MSQAHDTTVSKQLKNYFHDADIRKIASIQILWSGYGEIARYFIPSLNKSVVVKVVNPSKKEHHPRGWNGLRSHQRKLDSYKNEAIFYGRYACKTDASCRVPVSYSVNVETEELLISDTKDNKASAKAEIDISRRNEGAMPINLLIMEDLDHAGYSSRCQQATMSNVNLGIRWLAYFHARYLNQNLDELWSVGTYWHLATRPDEWANMPKSKVKFAAESIDGALNNASFQTLLHGDAKLANFCFTPKGNDIAAVDFQYVGRGVGVKDLMYFLGSCLDDEALLIHAHSLLNTYFAHLKEAITKYSVVVDLQKLEAEWRYLYPFAWADFQRFLLGWAPEHHKLNEYMNEQTEIALSNA